MKLTTYNVNGIRAAVNKGFLEWLSIENPDILCLQEVKATSDQAPMEKFIELGYHHISWLPASCKKGYSGVAILSKLKPLEVQTSGFHEQFDTEGRLISWDFEEFILINSYFPSGSSGDIRQDVKYKYLEFFDTVLEEADKPVLFCGDVNICHKDIDIHNPKGNQKSSGFLPEERQWIDALTERGYIDCFRSVNPNPDVYTWWSYRAGARQRNKGWRIDYFFADQLLKHRIENCVIQPEAVHSDHCPVHLILKDKS